MHPLEAQLPDMNESLVREAIIFPFIQRLGYQVGGAARVRTERPLQYSLGRKKSSDPVLRGRCDYICEVESYGRWVIEAKGGAETLTSGDAEQAHSYAHHAGVGGFFYLVTNGGLFRLYDRNPNQPIMEWRLAELDEKWSTIENLLGPEAIRRRAQTYKIDIGKPLGGGLGSHAKIVGGFLTYERHTTNNTQAAAQLEQLKGTRGTFTGCDVIRNNAGLIAARVEIVGPNKDWDELNKAAGITGYDFQCAVDVISSDPDSPSIFQGTVRGIIPRGVSTKVPGGQFYRWPMGVIMTASTEAVGFLDGNKFRGRFEIAYDYAADPQQPIDLSLLEGGNRVIVDQLLQVQPKETVEAIINQHIPGQLNQMNLASEGSFEMVVH